MATTSASAASQTTGNHTGRYRVTTARMTASAAMPTTNPIATSTGLWAPRMTRESAMTTIRTAVPAITASGAGRARVAPITAAEPPYTAVLIAACPLGLD